jgi:hypothetical protein
MRLPALPALPENGTRRNSCADLLFTGTGCHALEDGWDCLRTREHEGRQRPDRLIRLHLALAPVRRNGGGWALVSRSFRGDIKGDGIAHNGCHAPHQQERPRPPN